MSPGFHAFNDYQTRRPAGRRGRLFAVALAASAAVHAGVLVWMPGFGFDDYEPAKPSALEVVLVRPEPLRVAGPPAGAPWREPRARQHETKRLVARTPVQPQPQPRSRAAAPAPVPALPEPPTPAAETRFTVALPSAAETPVASSEPGVVAAAPERPVVSAAYLRNPPPRYPLAARRAGEQGAVMLKVLVTRDGLPARVDVEKTSGSTLLDGAALETVRTWRFVPARQGTEPIESWVLVPIVFRLEGVS